MTLRDEPASGPLRRLVDDDARAPGNEPEGAQRAQSAQSAQSAIDLVRAAPVYQPVPGRKQRLLLRLGRRRGARAPLLLRFAVAAGLLIGCAAVASAALGYLPRWVARAYERLAPERDATKTSSSAAHAGHRTHSRPVEAVPAAPADALAAEVPAVVEAPAAAESETAIAAARADRPAAKPRAPRAASPGARAEEDDASLVMQAMRALRREGDPVRARSLTDRYLRRHPDGKLAEEALALAIEAAIAHGDGDAPALGGRYLRRYPQGPFRGLALQATSSVHAGP